MSISETANQPKGPFTLPELPYSKDALAPHISSNTLDFHHGKHHNAYVTNLNGLIEGTEFKDMSLEDIMKKTADVADKAGVFNNAAQVWNHTFYWHSMKPQGGGEMPVELKTKIEASFGSVEKFKEEFATAAKTQFGSGWAWLVASGDKLEVVKTGNAANPLTSGKTPLLTIDVWEHAYYLDAQNRRPDYVSTFIESLANWDFALENLKKA